MGAAKATWLISDEREYWSDTSRDHGRSTTMPTKCGVSQRKTRSFARAGAGDHEGQGEEWGSLIFSKATHQHARHLGGVVVVAASSQSKRPANP